MRKDSTDAQRRNRRQERERLKIQIKNEEEEEEEEVKNIQQAHVYRTPHLQHVVRCMMRTCRLHAPRV